MNYDSYYADLEKSINEVLEKWDIKNASDDIKSAMRELVSIYIVDASYDVSLQHFGFENLRQIKLLESNS